MNVTNTFQVSTQQSVYGDNMNNQVLMDNTVVYYVIMVEGKVVSQRFDSKMIAEMEKQKLPMTTQGVATVEAVDASGRQLLLG